MPSDTHAKSAQPNVVLAATHHDPDGRLFAQTARVAPLLMGLVPALVILATSTTQTRSVELLRSLGAVVSHEAANQVDGLSGIGRARRGTLALALQQPAPTIMFCDFDRALHWAEYHHDELASVLGHLSAHDCTVLGRTPRAFASHPRMQRDTEAIVNERFAAFSGNAWDVTAAARGLSRRAAEAILAGCPDETVGTDISWPLHLARHGYTLGYCETEGLEFETADRYADQVAAAGGLQAWIDTLDQDPQRWVERLEIARLEVAALLLTS